MQHPLTGAPLRFVAVAALTLVVSIILLPPWTPAMPAAGLDPSWIAVLSHAFNHRWQFGTEIVLTYGPYGFLSTSLFDPENYALLLAFWLALAATLAVAMVSLVDPQRLVESVVIIALTFVGLRAGLTGPQIFQGHFFNDPLFFLVPLLTLFVYLHPNRIVARWLVPPLMALTALVGLIKFSFALVGFVIVVLIELSRLSRRRIIPIYLLSYVACAAVFFVLAGQRLENFAAYIGTSLTVTSGYSEAMQVYGDSAEVTSFLATAGCILLLAAYAEWGHGTWRTGDRQGGAVLLALTLFIFIAFKAGFVRHDFHSVIAWSSLSAGSALYASRFVRIVPGPGWRLGMLALCFCATGLAVRAHEDKTGESPGAFLDRNFGTGLLDRSQALADTLLHPGRPQLLIDREKALARIREQNPLPRLPGTVDIYPWNAAVLLAHGLEYRPRPVYQSYVVYNGALMAINRKHLESERAASTLIFDMETIDRRFRALDEGALWPALIAHYEAAGTADGHLLLQRRRVPRQVEFRMLGEYRTNWSTPLAVPSGALTWATIEIDKTLLGRLANVFFKLPPIELSLTLGNGSVWAYRLVPDMARRGFLLTPIVHSSFRFAQMVGNDPALLAPAEQVVSLTLRAPEGVTSYYRDSIRVTFQALSLAALVPVTSTSASPDLVAHAVHQ